MAETETDERPAAGGSPYMRALTRKVGPLPLWGWGVVGVGAVAAFVFLRRGSGGKAETIGPFSYVPGAGSGGPGGGAGGGSGGGGGVPTTPGAGPTNGPSAGGPGSGPSTRPGGTAAQDRSEAQPVTFTADVDPAEVGEGARFRTRLTAAGVDRIVNTTTQMAQNALRTNSTVYATAGGVRSANEAVVANLTRSGYTAGIVGGQVLAARDSGTYFRTLPAADQKRLATWLAATGAK